MVVVIDSSVPGRVAHLLPAWRKCMPMTIRPTRTTDSLVCQRLTPLVGKPVVGSCTCSLRIIAPPRKPGRMSPYHPMVRGHCHDSRPLFLSPRAVGSLVALCHAPRSLPQPMRSGTGHASHAHHAAASTLQGAQAVCRPHPQAPLCPV